MHEFSTVHSILEVAFRAAKEHGANKIIEIDLEIGKLTFLNVEQIRFIYPILTEGTIAEGSKLRIREIEPQIKCTKCKYKGKLVYDGPETHLPYAPMYLRCPRCGETQVELVRGRECNLKSMKIETKKTKGSSAAGSKKVEETTEEV
jgi:hydrogenase nickel incorporation protein HypA/HybF